MRYPIQLTPDGKFLMATFPDIPEAITQGRNIAEAKKAALDALESALDFYVEEGRIIPALSHIKRGQEFVELPASMAAKVLLLNEMRRQKVRPAELARKLHTTPQEVNRLTDIRHTSRIDGIHAAMRALGKTIEIRVA